jgi:hypothetical protein
MIPHLNRSRGMDLKRGEQEKKSTGKKNNIPSPALESE